MTIDYALDPAISPELLTEAHDALPVSYDEILAQIEISIGQDDVNELGAGGAQVPATPAQALANAQRLSIEATYVGIGYCLATVRGREFVVLPLWPDANTAWKRATLKHRETDPAKIPRGAIVYWTNDRYGHVALSAGGGMCWTTDYRRPGRVDLVPIALLASWCRGTLVGWAEDLNGVDCWPTPAKPKPTPREFTVEDRIKTVRAALGEARNDDSPAWEIRGLREWLHQLEGRKKRLDAKAAKK